MTRRRVKCAKRRPRKTINGEQTRLGIWADRIATFGCTKNQEGENSGGGRRGGRREKKNETDMGDVEEEELLTGSQAGGLPDKRNRTQTRTFFHQSGNIGKKNTNFRQN